MATPPGNDAGALEPSRALLQHLPAAVVVADTADRVVVWNAEAESLFGWTAPQAQGRDVRELVISPARHAHARAILDAVRGGQQWTGTHGALRRDGTRRPVSTHLRRVVDDEGRVRGVVGVSVGLPSGDHADAAGRPVPPERAVQAQALEATGRLTAAIAHDFNNLLTVMQGYGELLERAVADDPVAAAHLTEIKQATARAAGLVGQLLAFRDAAPSAAATAERSETIVLVEQQATVRFLIATTLSERGYQVLEAPSGADALELAAGLHRADLLLTETRLPDVDGLELVARLRRRHPSLRVLFLLAPEEPSTEAEGLEGSSFLTKPFGAHQLLVAVDGLLAP